METADVVVAGAGIVGCATAYAMARRGLSVVLLDKGAVGGAVSGASLACIGTHMIEHWVWKLATHPKILDMIERLELLLQDLTV